MPPSGVKQSKKARVKAPKSRPESTFSTPRVTPGPQGLSQFSKDGGHFALLSLSVDKHRLRVYDTRTSQSIAEHLVDSGRVTCLQWACLDLSGNPDVPAVGSEAPSPSKKKRKTRDTTASETKQASPGVHVVLLGLSDGSICCFSHSHGRVVRVLSRTKDAAPVHAITTLESPPHKHKLWSTNADGAIFCWDVRTGEVIGTWKSGSPTPYSAIAIRPPTDEDAPSQLVAANRSIHLLSLDSPHLGTTSKVKELATFTGHASSVSNIYWETPSRFITSAESDRFLYVWEVPEVGSNQGHIVFSAPLDSEVRSLSFFASQLLAISTSGRISIFSLPSDSSSSSHVVNLEPVSTVAVSYKKASSNVEVVSASFLPRGQLRIATVSGGVKPVFDTTQYQSPDGNYLSEVNVVVQDAGNVLVSDPVHEGPSGRRYAEPSSLKIHSGVELGQDPAADNLAIGETEGVLDVDLAELSLGQRLTAISGGDQAGQLGGSSESESEEDGSTRQPSGKSGRSKNAAPDSVPASSLTRTLIQALHSSDSRLLETCLTHSDPLLIRSTVQKLPPQLAVPLLIACVDRLGRGHRAANMKGGGGGASSQRGISLIAWVKVVLTVHSGHLMTMPDLITRLSGLHAVLTSRLALQESLLNLSGRLDMALSQMEARSSNAPAAPTTVPKAKQAGAPQVVKRYVEGESEDEEENNDVEIEVDDDGGSLEDVELGGFDDMEEDEEEEEEGDSDEDGPGLNGFIDDEAEEDYSEDEDEEDFSE
ncbi:WD40-repeat-containing domain protein [Thelephora terrestris]|uniref:WD40-repeat-containing domain protein n=1 Tax=Thelephora terrestris TaxID=56493 RepID=A0A9P6HHG5_9AGAM|nr:WD40-repeat-containing domain protein [Thelephora terrestris]